MMEISIIIVNWNTRDYLKKALVSIYAECKKSDFEIIVVDNNSADCSVEMLGKDYPEVKVIANPCNNGFGKAVNQGIKSSSSKYVVVLNSDIEVKDDFLSSFIEFAESNKDAGVLAPKLLNTDGSLQVSFNMFYPGIVGFFLSRLFFFSYFSLKFKSCNLARRLFYSPWKPKRVAWAGGSCLFIRREALEKSGNFDEGYFMYGEEIDLCRRINQNGYKIYYIPTINVIHHQFKSSENNFDRVFMEMYKSDIHYFRKYSGNLILELVKLGMLFHLTIKKTLIRLFATGDRRIHLADKTISCLELKDPLRKLYLFCRFPLVFLVSIFNFNRRKQKKVKNIVLFRLDRIGDFVLSLPVLDSLKLEYPEAKITLVVRPYLKGLTGMIRSIDNVCYYESFTKTIRELRKEQYDIAIDLIVDWKIKTALLTFFSGATVRAGFKWGFRELLFTHSVDHVIGGSMTAKSLELLKVLNISPKVTIPKINTVPLKKELVTVHPGAFHKSRTWEKKKFAELAGKIANNLGEKVIIIGGEGDRTDVEEISRIAGSNVTSDINDLKGLVEVLLKSKVLICNNSGPLHLASALGVPTVSTLGPADHETWFPIGEKNVVISKDLECSGCSLAECGIHKCMELITVEEMFEAVESIIRTAKK